MPAEVMGALAQYAVQDEVPRLDQPDALLALLRDAEATLLARLLTGEVAR